MTRHWLDDIEHMHDDMERLSRALMTAPLIDYKDRGITAMRPFRSPVVNQYETKESLITEIELPGVDKKDIELNVTDEFAEVKVEKKEELERKDKGFYRFESRCASFYRKIPFPVDVKAGQGEAAFKDGVLRLEMPKARPAPEEKARKLEIK